VDRDPARGPIDRERAGRHALTKAGLRPSQHGVDPRDQLLVVERPREKVITAALEGVHAVDRVGSSLAQHDHRHVAVPRATRLAFAQDATHLERRRIG
jgi:hypothetical protein